MSKQAKSYQGQVRIIGGQWRGRKLPVSDWEGLRPTSDRVRETLFNWLTPAISGASCVDLFAGSGALGFEALSRGASNCLFVDSNARGCRSLNQLIEQLGATDRASVFCGDALQAPLESKNYDVVFIDPPFGAGLVNPCLDWLIQGGYLSEHALIYVETEKDFSVDTPSLHLLKEKTAGEVYFRLYEHQP